MKSHTKIPRLILASLLKILVGCFFLLVIFTDTYLAVEQIDKPDQYSYPALSDNEIIAEPNLDKNKDLNAFSEVFKYSKELNTYQKELRQNNNNENLDDVQGMYYSGNNNRRVVYWTVTEDGLFYCSSNCLKSQKKSKASYLTESFHSPNQGYDYKKRLTDMFKSDLFGNTINHTFSLVDTLNNNGESSLKEYGYSKSGTGTNNYQLSGRKDSKSTQDLSKSEQLKCTPFSNETQYDFLKGIKRRRKLKGLPEPELITIFDRSGQIDISILRIKLIRMKKEKLNGVKLFNRIGNYYRMIGNAWQSVECFRKALYIEPYNSDVLINTARLLLKLKYYDDAIFLTRKSLEYIRSDRSPWLQHFTLAEILKINGYLEEAELHIEYTLKLKPNYMNGVKLLKEIRQLQQLFIKKHSSSYFNGEPDQHAYIFYITPTIYVRVTFNMIMALLFLVAAILCGLLGVIFDEDEKEPEDALMIKNAKTSKLSKDLKSLALGDLASKKSARNKKF